MVVSTMSFLKAAELFPFCETKVHTLSLLLVSLGPGWLVKNNGKHRSWRELGRRCLVRLNASYALHSGCPDLAWSKMSPDLRI
jgi:hypothetical protein